MAGSFNFLFSSFVNFSLPGVCGGDVNWMASSKKGVRASGFGATSNWSVLFP